MLSTPTSKDDLFDASLRFLKNSKGIAYGNFPVAFDIEVSSFYRLKSDPSIQRSTPPESDKEALKWEKCACMYAFVFGINGKAYVGRTWDDAMGCFEMLSSFYSLDENKRVIVYVHNLGYEFQFLRHRFEWDSVFSLSERDPVKALTKTGIEFRCSYHLSGYSLASVGRNLAKYKVEKRVGDLDYSLPRGEKTPLTEKEVGYVLHDGLVVMAYIQERIEQDGNITRIPLTKTGYVRKYCRKMTLYGGSGDHRSKIHQKYRKLMGNLVIKSPQEYEQLKRAFQGGFTHANALRSGLTLEDVTSYDFTSSYPYCMVAYQYPMSAGKLVTIDSKDAFERYLRNYCCLFDVRFEGLESIFPYDHPISSSKCVIEGRRRYDNGRIISADVLVTTITEQDYFVYKRFYSWKRMAVSRFRIYCRGYLPTPFVSAILTLYKDKTVLKGAESLDDRINYMKSKEQLNSCYGMTVTDICRPEVTYEDGVWGCVPPEIKSALEKYDASKQRFLFYAWGVWVTAYARRDLFSGLYSCGEDDIYVDTDSIKLTNAAKHKAYFERYNANARMLLERAMAHHKLPFEMVEPSTRDGKKKLLGAWDFDGHYRRFKTLGAKRYMIEDDDGNRSLTVSGLDKRSAIPYLEKKAKEEGKDIFDLFEDGMEVPAGNSGRNVHTYIDYAQQGVIKDYLGGESPFSEYSSIHIEETSYTLGMADDYINLILGLRQRK